MYSNFDIGYLSLSDNRRGCNYHGLCDETLPVKLLIFDDLGKNEIQVNVDPKTPPHMHSFPSLLLSPASSKQMEITAPQEHGFLMFNLILMQKNNHFDSLQKYEAHKLLSNFKYP